MSVRYVLREGFSGFFRARLAVIASITAIALAVFLVSVMGRLGWNAYQVAVTLKRSVEVELFLKDLSAGERDRLITTLKREKAVAKVTYISKDSAAALFMASFGAEGQALADLEFLPASLQLRMHETVTLEQLDAAVERWRKIPVVEELKYNRQLVELLEKRLDSLMMLGLGLGGLILLIAIVLVFNTIRLTIYAKRNVIRAMKLVGATNGFVRRPFQVEGLLQAVTGTALALGAHHLLFAKAVPYFIPQLNMLEWPYGDWKVLAGACLAMALLLGLAGSSLATRTFIRNSGVS